MLADKTCCCNTGFSREQLCSQVYTQCYEALGIFVWQQFVAVIPTASLLPWLASATGLAALNVFIYVFISTAIRFRAKSRSAADQVRLTGNVLHAATCSPAPRTWGSFYLVGAEKPPRDSSMPRAQTPLSWLHCGEWMGIDYDRAPRCCTGTEETCSRGKASRVVDACP